MKKRGQVTLFIILGIVVVVVIGFIYFNRSIIIKTGETVEQSERFVSSRLEPIKTLVENCVKETSLKGILILGKQGGKFNPARSIELGGFKVGYSCYKIDNERINLLPLVSQMNDDLNNYMAESNTISEINNCINDFKTFEEDGLDIREQGKLEVNGNILDDLVRLDIEYPLEIRKNDYSATIRDMFVEIPIGLGKAYNIALDITNAECNGQEFDYDMLGLNEPVVTSNIQDLNGQDIVYLTTIPKSKNEIQAEFNFIIQK